MRKQALQATLAFTTLASGSLALADELVSIAPRSQIRPFTTDSCTLFLNGTLNDGSQWRHCCIVHDIDYWLGGNESLRLTSDSFLGSCANVAAGLPRQAEFGLALTLATDALGHESLPTWWRWGYGRVRPSLAPTLGDAREKLTWARGWLASERFREEFNLTKAQQAFILRALDYKIRFPRSSAFLGSAELFMPRS